MRIASLPLPLLALTLAACGEHVARGAEVATPPAAATDSAAGTTATATPASATTAGGPSADSAIVRALYVNRFGVQSTKRMAKMIAIADSTEINALVLDMKDEFGLNYKSAIPAVARNAGTAGTVRNLEALLDTLKAHDILPIARLVVFKDSVTARLNPGWTIRKADGSPWRDHQGLAWVNPYNRELWEYNLSVAEELVKLGFGEVQFDYIRFPEPYKSLPQQVFPDTKGQSKPEVLAEFLKTANARFDKLGVRTTADIFGLVTTVKGPLEIGQEWEKIAPVTDVLLPMVYPSHYPRGSFGVARPNAEPYKIIYTAIKRARERNEKLGIHGGRENVRPWLQAFSLGQPKYDASHMREQIRAVYDAGYDGWVLWSPGSNYDLFVPAFAKTTESRKKSAAEAN
jgi:hypothetical protein